MTGVSGAAASSVVGVALAAALDVVDLDSCDDHDIVEQIAGWERVIAWAQSRQLAAAAEFARRPSRIETPHDDRAAVLSLRSKPGTWVREFADDELAARLRISRMAAAGRIRIGCALTRLPHTATALRSGRIDLPRARVLVDETADLDPDTARAVEAHVIESACDQSAARLRPRVRRAVLAVDPIAAHHRTERARDERHVVVSPAPHGMAELYARLPATDAVAIRTAITAAARASKAGASPDDDRTMDQRMADALTAPFLAALVSGVLDGAEPQPLAKRRGEPAALLVTVAASTMLGADDSPAELAGYGPITAATARGLAPDARWRRVLTDPRSGAVLDVGTTVYRPPAPLARHVEVRDQLCQAPECGWPADRSELDHTIEFPEGPTSADNLGARCGRHHRLKHSGTVRVERRTDGTTTWTMPTGHTYDVRPAPVGLPRRDPPSTDQDRPPP